jgi:hypothetical protein
MYGTEQDAVKFAALGIRAGSAQGIEIVSCAGGLERETLDQ